MQIATDDYLLELLQKQNRTPRIFLDGIKQEWVIAANEETGELTRYVLDARGEIAIDPKTDSARKETVRGKVRILLDEAT